MEIIELTKENIDRYMDDCVEAQKYLLQSSETIREEQFRTTATAESTYFIGILEEGHIVGLGVVNKIVHPVETNAYVDNIVVHPDFRGRGYFTELMDALEKKAKQWGAEGIKLTCSRDTVQPLYEKRGYKEKTTTKYYVKKV